MALTQTTMVTAASRSALARAGRGGANSVPKRPSQGTCAGSVPCLSSFDAIDHSGEIGRKEQQP
jgi:hypothetical protein